MVGLYETALDELCRYERDGRRVGPKIVASTATVRRAQSQIRALFNRKTVDIFPPPGPDRRDSFFAEVHPPSKSNARLLIPHSVAAHRLMGGGGYSIAEAVVRHYNAAGWPLGVKTLTDWWRPVRKIVGDTSATFEPVAQLLADHGYLIPAQTTGTGRWGRHYRANRNLSGIEVANVGDAA